MRARGLVAADDGVMPQEQLTEQHVIETSGAVVKLHGYEVGGKGFTAANIETRPASAAIR